MKKLIIPILLIFFTFSCKQGQEGKVTPNGRINTSITDNSSKKYQDLYKSFVNADPSTTFNENLSNLMSGPSSTCGVSENEEDYSRSVNNHNIGVGAQKALMTMFQSCRALRNPLSFHHTQNPKIVGLQGIESSKSYGDQHGIGRGYIRKIVDVKKYNKTHPIIAVTEGRVGPGCRDARKSPQVFGFSSKKQLDSTGKTVQIFSGSKGLGVAHDSIGMGVDCTGFVSVALAAAGAKVRPFNDTFLNLSTKGLHAAARDPESCLYIPEFSANDNIRKGDILNTREGHAIIIDSIGPDPLGVKSAIKKRNCGEISTQSFDFTYAHSGALAGTKYHNIGPSRVHSSFNLVDPTLIHLLKVARDTCSAAVNGALDEKYKTSIAFSEKVSLIRHKKEQPECVGEPKKLEGEECINGCFKDQGEA